MVLPRPLSIKKKVGQKYSQPPTRQAISAPFALVRALYVVGSVAAGTRLTKGTLSR